MANLLPSTKSAILKQNKSAIVKADKFIGSSPKDKTKTTKIKTPKKPGQNLLLSIQRKVIKIDKLLKNSLELKKKDNERQRRGKEKGSFEEKEKELEKKKQPKVKGINLPSTPKLGIFGWIKNFIFNTLLGFIAIRLIDHLPKLQGIFSTVLKVGEFIIDMSGKLLDGLVTFIDWGYKAIDGTRNFMKQIGGENFAQMFDKFAGAIDNVLEIAVIAAIVTASQGRDDGFGGGGGRPRKGFDSTGRRVSVGAQKRYAQRFGRDQFLKRFGKRNLINLGEKGAAKGILSTLRPFLKRIPIPVIGALIDFGLSWALGENPGRAAFRAIGAGILGAIGGGLAGALGLAGGPLALATGALGALAGGTLGDMAGGALYDLFFGGKKPKQQGKTNKLAGGGKPVSAKGRRPVARSFKKKKKVSRTFSIVPPKIKPGRNAGGDKKIQSVFPNPEKPQGFLGWLQSITGGGQQQQQKSKKPSVKSANPQEFLITSNDILGKGVLGPIFTLAFKAVLGDTPGRLDYKNVGKGLNSWMQQIFKSETLGFAGGGEVDARQFFSGEDYTNTIAKSVEESVSGKINTVIRNLQNELSLRPVGREEMIQDNIRRTDTELNQQDENGGSLPGLTVGKWGPILDLISKTEGGYDSVNPGLKRPQILGMTIKELVAFQKQSIRQHGGTAAAGRYQFLYPEGAAKLAGISLDEKFTKENQDKMAVAYLEKKRRGRDWLSGKISDEAFMQDLADEWASLPNAQGKFSYSGQSSGTTPKMVKDALAKVRKGGYSQQELAVNTKEKPGGSYTQLSNNPDAKRGSKLAGELGRFLDKKGLGGWGSGVHQHPEHPPWSPESGHSPGSLHYASKGARAIDIGGYGRSRGYDDQDKILAGIAEFNKMKGVKPVQLLKDGYPGHDNHVHVAYLRGGRVRKPTFATLAEDGKPEFVFDADTTAGLDRLAPQLLERLNMAKTKPQIASILQSYTDYERPEPEIQYIEVPVEVPVPIPMGGGSSGMMTSGRGIDNTDYETLEML